MGAFTLFSVSSLNSMNKDNIQNTNTSPTQLTQRPAQNNLSNLSNNNAIMQTSNPQNTHTPLPWTPKSKAARDDFDKRHRNKIKDSLIDNDSLSRHVPEDVYSSQNKSSHHEPSPFITETPAVRRKLSHDNAYPPLPATIASILSSHNAQ